MLRKTTFGLMTLAVLALSAPSTASARGGGGFHGGGGGFHGGGFRGGGWHGGGFRRGWGGTGIGFGLAGAGLYGGYYGYGPYGYAGGYPYAYGGYDDEGGCFLERQRIRTPSGYRVRRVEVCR